MEQETLYAAAKWDMLKALEYSGKSPAELAEKSNTSVSNVSQSLRFLEMAGIVKSERISNRDKGQPRVLYSLQGNSAYLIVTAKNFVNKMQIPLTSHKKIILKIWFYEKESLHPFLEKAVSNIYEILSSLQGVFLDTSGTQEIKLVLLGNGKKDIKNTSANVNGTTKKVSYSFLSEQEIKKSASKFYALYDPLQICGGAK